MAEHYYCERIDFSVLGEPLNSLTNFFFILVAIILIFDKSIKDKIFPTIIFFIGIGSLLFHSFANGLTAFLDVFFIVLFIYYYLACLYLKLNFSKILCYILPLIFLVICYFFGIKYSNSFLKTSSFYVPILIHLIILYFYFLINKNKLYYHKLFLLITFVFAISLTLRSIDNYTCAIFPIGTHFLWHILNSLFLYFLVKYYYLINHRTSPKEPS